MLPYLKKSIQPKKKKKVIGKPFNPNFDGNLLAWYDGDTLATDPANTWSDRSANSYDLTLFNAPSIINNGLNGFDTLRFNGINQYGQTAAFARNQPHTFYIVINRITVIPGVFMDSVVTIFTAILQDQTSPDTRLYAGTPNVNYANPQLALNTYNIMTGVFNGANSELRTNNSIAVVANPGISNGSGLTLAADQSSGSKSNIEVAYLILRSGGDNTATQNLFINYLKNRFAL